MMAVDVLIECLMDSAIDVIFKRSQCPLQQGSGVGLSGESCR